MKHDVRPWHLVTDAEPRQERGHHQPCRRAPGRTAARANPRRRACASGSGTRRRTSASRAQQGAAPWNTTEPGRTIRNIPAMPASTSAIRGARHPLPEKDHRQDDDEDRRSVVDRRRLGERQVLERAEEAQRRQRQHQRRGRAATSQARRAEEAGAHLRQHPAPGSPRSWTVVARPDQERDRVAVRQQA